MRVGKSTIQFVWFAVAALCTPVVSMAQTSVDTADADVPVKPIYTMHALTVDDTVAGGEGGCGDDPNCVPCEPNFACPPIDLVVIVDTSGSMRDEAEALCGQLDAIVNDLAALGVNLSPTVLGITNVGDISFTCLQDDVVSLLGDSVPGVSDTCEFPGGDAAFESWGPATAIVADRFGWTPDAVRLVVPVSDEAPCNGSRPDGCHDPGDDRDSITNASTIASAKNVIVSPILGTGSDACTTALAESIAQATGGNAHTLADAAADIRSAIFDAVLAHCEPDASCDDGSVCTTDDSCVDGVCIGTPTHDPQQFCCDPVTGALTERNDGNDCTDDLCDPATGEVTHVPSAIGTPCDDLSDCTYDDFCDDSATCVGNLIDGTPCSSDTDCRGQHCDLDTGTCVCTDEPELCLAVRPPASGEGCHEVGEEVVVDIELGFSTNVIVGADLFFEYDPSLLRFESIVPGNAVDANSPFKLQLFQDVDELTGTVFYSVGIDLGSVGTQGPTILAQARFTALAACQSTELCWLTGNPKRTALSNDRGQGVPFEVCCSGPVFINSSNFDFTCPDSAVLNAAPGSPGPVLNWVAPAASSDCQESVDVSCTATHSDGLDIDFLIPMGGRFPAGTSTFACTATDACGTATTCTWVIEATDQQIVELDLELSPTIDSGQDGTTLERCIEFEFYSNCATEAVRLEQTVEFGPPFNLQGQAIGVQLAVPPGDYQCMTARDPLHSVRAVALMDVVGDHYFASFRGDPIFGGNWLINGNLDGNGVIDVVDFGLFVDYYQTAAAGDTPCGISAIHADFNGDAFVDDRDWQFISDHLDMTDAQSCCTTTAGAESAISEIGVRELKRRGLDHLIKADLNFDGWLNRTDVELFASEGISGIPTGKQPHQGRTVRSSESNASK